MPFGYRPDGDLVKDIGVTRRIMPLLMRKRNESIVFFRQKLRVKQALQFLEEFRKKTGLKATILHLYIYGAVQALSRRPRLNRFVSGGRIYQRRGIWISYSAKREKSDDHPVIVIKQEFKPEMSFAEIVSSVKETIASAKTSETHSEKELKFFFRFLPTPLLSLFVRLVMWLDHLGLLPGFFIRPDPMFASLFIANLGSLEMEAPFHHLYEYGNIPIFIALGKVQPEVVVNEKGEIQVEPILTVRYSFDERIEDGLYCAQSLEILRQYVEEPFKLIPF